MDNLEVGGEVPLGPEPGRAVEAEVDILVLLAAVQRQVPATDEQQGTAIMMFFQKTIEVHGYISVKSYSKTLL